MAKCQLWYLQCNRYSSKCDLFASNEKISQKKPSVLARIIIFSYFSQAYQGTDRAFNVLSKGSTKVLPQLKFRTLK